MTDCELIYCYCSIVEEPNKASSISLKKPSATADEQQLVMTEQIDGGPTAGIQVVDNISSGKVR